MSRKGLDALHAQFAALQDTLKTFDDPELDEHPGLGLMAEALRERTEHVRTTIAAAERSSLTVRLEGHATVDGSVPLRVVVPVLDALADAVAASAAVVDAQHGAEAAALHLVSMRSEGGAVELELARPPGPLEAQLVDGASGAVVVDLALVALGNVLSGGDSADDPVAAAAAPGVARLATTLRGAGVAATLSFAPVTRRGRDVELTSADVARLVVDGS